MRTIGSLINQARKRRKISIAALSQKTKIKPRYISAIEREEWQVIPNFAIATGFVRNIAGVVGIDPETAVAILRRDFQEQPKHTFTQPRALWTPKTTVILLSIVVAFALIFYLARQYLTYVAPPPLYAEAKRNGESVEIFGKTDKEASVLINGEPVLVEEDGAFKISFTASSGQFLTVEALSRSGKATKKEIIVP